MTKFRHTTQSGRTLKFQSKAHRDRWLRGLNAGRKTQKGLSKFRKHKITVKGSVLSVNSNTKKRRHNFRVLTKTEFGQGIQVIESEPAKRKYIPAKLNTSVKATANQIDIIRRDSKKNEIFSTTIIIDPVIKGTVDIALEESYRKFLKQRDPLLRLSGDEKRLLLNNLAKELRPKGFVIKTGGKARQAKGGGLDRAIQNAIKTKDAHLKKEKLKLRKIDLKPEMN